MSEFLKYESNNTSKTFVVAEVAANETIRKNLINLSNEMEFQPVFPSKEYCSDNAAMIAWAGI